MLMYLFKLTALVTVALGTLLSATSPVGAATVLPEVASFLDTVTYDASTRTLDAFSVAASVNVDVPILQTLDFWGGRPFDLHVVLKPDLTTVDSSLSYLHVAGTDASVGAVTIFDAVVTDLYFADEKFWFTATQKAANTYVNSGTKISGILWFNDGKTLEDWVSDFSSASLEAKVGVAAVPLPPAIWAGLTLLTGMLGKRLISRQATPTDSI